jgi:protein ImuB
MSGELYACLHLREFPLQSHVRLRPDLKSVPVAVLDGRPPTETVCSSNRAARQLGCASGMTRVEAESIPGLRLLPRAPEIESVASGVLLECAANYSPRIEERIAGTQRACVLDIAGTQRLFGTPPVLSGRIRESLAGAGFHAAIGVSANFHTAWLKAASANGIVIVANGREAEQLASLPLSVLELPEKEAETFAAWCIGSLGELAALPEDELISRMGQTAKRWRDMALGRLPHLFQPVVPQVALKEYSEFEPPVENLDSLLFVASPMLESLGSRAAGRALLLSCLNITFHLEGGRTHTLIVRPALPTIDRKFLLKLLQIELAAHPPPYAVCSFTMEAEVGRGSNVQLGLFSPQLPDPRRLDVTLARLKALVGEDNVGSPILDDSTRANAFHMEQFTVSQRISTADCKPRMALRRMRPPHPVRVRCVEQKPVSFHDGKQSYSIFAAYGPWRANGNWWVTKDWDREEWDVLIAQEQQAYLLVNDRTANRWYLDAVYD